MVLARVEALTDPDHTAEAFSGFQMLVEEREEEAEGQQGRGGARAGSKRKVAEAEEEETEVMEEEPPPCTDAAVVRFAAMCGWLRLVRAHDAALSADAYVSLALGCQDSLPEPRKAIAGKLGRTLHHFLQRAAQPQRAAKYAALLALAGADPVPENRTQALLLLRQYAAARRAAVAAAAAAAAAAGRGGTMMQDMAEFLLPYLVYVLAHHPDYPQQEVGGGHAGLGVGSCCMGWFRGLGNGCCLAGCETAMPLAVRLLCPLAVQVLEWWAGLSQEEREQAEEEGQVPPLQPFLGMLQLALEPLLLLAEHGSPEQPARLLPPVLKLLRTLKHCRDSHAEEPRTDEARAVCDMALALCKAITLRASKGKPIEQGRFPGTVLVPKQLFVSAVGEEGESGGGQLGDIGFKTWLLPTPPRPCCWRQVFSCGA